MKKSPQTVDKLQKSWGLPTVFFFFNERLVSAASGRVPGGLLSANRTRKSSIGRILANFAEIKAALISLALLSPGSSKTRAPNASLLLAKAVLRHSFR
ncbi:hypothetical protein ABE021_04395 [Sporosarcina gallistercoris]|uniref:hypothetical protein n=1 Tax=Sporosarcina gallistercoris TaxID=2762245 RepID=UPI003D2D1341